MLDLATTFARDLTRLSDGMHQDVKQMVKTTRFDIWLEYNISLAFSVFAYSRQKDEKEVEIYVAIGYKK